MMRWTLLVAALAGGVVWWLRRQFAGHYVSARWLDEREWYESRQGIDQACVQRWPINKLVNESAAFQARRLRKRA